MLARSQGHRTSEVCVASRFNVEELSLPISRVRQFREDGLQMLHGLSESHPNTWLRSTQALF